MSLNKILFRSGAKRFSKKVLNRESFGKIVFSIDGDNVKFNVDEETEGGTMDPEDFEILLKMIPIKGFKKMEGVITMEGVKATVVSYDNYTKKDYTEILEI